MPRYYFNMVDGRTVLDDEGVELRDLSAARAEALRTSGEMLRDGTQGPLWDGHPWRMWVTDQPGGAGTTLLTLRFSATAGPEKLAG